MIHFIGAGPGAADLITVRGARLLGEADTIIYAGSLVNPALLEYKKPGCRVYDSASMTLEEVLAVMDETEKAGGVTVRLHTGDPSLYGAIREQMDALDERGYAYDVTPGVSAFSGAAAALEAEYTLPDVSQSVIITRMAGRTPVPEKEKLSLMASHGCTMVLFLSTGLLEEVERELQEGGYGPHRDAAGPHKNEPASGSEGIRRPALQVSGAGEVFRPRAQAPGLRAVSQPFQSCGQFPRQGRAAAGKGDEVELHPSVPWRQPWVKPGS